MGKFVHTMDRKAARQNYGNLMMWSVIRLQQEGQSNLVLRRMRHILFFVFSTLLLVTSCKTKSYSDVDIKSLTGWFYVIDSDNGIPLLDKKMLKKIYIDPKPIITDKNFKTAKISEDD